MNMENKYLQVRKEGIFARFINFIKRISGQKLEQEIPSQVESIENKQIKSSFFNEIKIRKEKNKELLDLQRKYQNNELDLAVLSDEEIDELDSLYKRQVSDLKRKLDNKKTQLAIIKNRINNYSTNM
ncbi:MAG: hypothetical protein ACI4VQ_06890 [Clostridia bacterium]